MFALARPLRCDVLCRLNEKELEINEIQLPLPFGTYAQQQPMAAVERIQCVSLFCTLSQSPSRAFRAHTCVCVCALRLCRAGFVFLFVFVCSRICVCTDFYHSLLIAADMTRRRARCFVFVCIAFGEGRAHKPLEHTHTHIHRHVHSLSARIVGCVLIRQVCVIILLFSEQLLFVSCCCCCCCSKGLR